MTGLFSTWFVQSKRSQSSRSHKKVLQIFLQFFSYFWLHPKRVMCKKASLWHRCNFSSMIPSTQRTGTLLYPLVLALLWKRRAAQSKQESSNWRRGVEEDPREERQQQMCEKRKTGEGTETPFWSIGRRCNKRIHGIQTRRIRCDLRFLFHLG